MITRSSTDNLEWCSLGQSAELYLGITLTSDLSWSPHISVCCNKTRKLIGFQPGPVTLHEKTMHNALSANLRYEPKLWTRVNFVDYDFFTRMDRGVIPLHKSLLCSLQNAVLFELWLDEMTHVATRSTCGKMIISQLQYLHAKKAPKAYISR